MYSLLHSYYMIAMKLWNSMNATAVVIFTGDGACMLHICNIMILLIIWEKKYRKSIPENQNPSGRLQWATKSHWQKSDGKQGTRDAKAMILELLVCKCQDLKI
jgi:hypothetical protein